MLTVEGHGARAGKDVCVYFDNNAKVHAPHDALALAARLAAFNRTSGKG